MKQEDKDLLLKDLCARLPYEIKAVLKQTNCYDSINKVSEKDIYSFRTGRPLEEDHGQHDYYKVIVTDIKPYLFPLSSMTEEQKEEYNQSRLKDLRMLNSVLMERINDENNFDRLVVAYNEIDWLNKNHFDYRGLILKGLAIDATNKNIYQL